MRPAWPDRPAGAGRQRQRTGETNCRSPQARAQRRPGAHALHASSSEDALARRRLAKTAGDGGPLLWAIKHEIANRARWRLRHEAHPARLIPRSLSPGAPRFLIPPPTALPARNLCRSGVRRASGARHGPVSPEPGPGAALFRLSQPPPLAAYRARAAAIGAPLRAGCQPLAGDRHHGRTIRLAGGCRTQGRTAGRWAWRNPAGSRGDQRCRGLRAFRPAARACLGPAPAPCLGGGRAHLDRRRQPRQRHRPYPRAGARQPPGGDLRHRRHHRRDRHHRRLAQFRAQLAPRARPIAQRARSRPRRRAVLRRARRRRGSIRGRTGGRTAGGEEHRRNPSAVLLRLLLAVEPVRLPGRLPARQGPCRSARCCCATGA